MLRRKARFALAKTLVVASAAIVVLYANSSNPPLGRTGGFGESTCQSCHEFGPGDGELDILDVPDFYTPGEVYTITVQLNQDGQSRWGFQLAVRFVDDGTQAGQILQTDPVNTQLRELAGVQYINHTRVGTMEGTPDGPVTWTFDWQAPDEGFGTVEFDAAGNAADDDSSPDGDYIYTTQAFSDPADGGAINSAVHWYRNAVMGSMPAARRAGR